MSSTNTKYVQTFPILGILGLIFITLKLTGHITWSWWWVTAPFWGGFAFIVGLMVVVFVGGLLIVFLKWLLDRN